MGSALKLGLRTLAREWRSGDLAVLFLALFVAVAALTGVGFLADRVQRAMLLQANEVLAADLRSQSGRPLDEQYYQEADRLGLQSARLASMLSVVLKGDATQLANVHAASEGYPLRGLVEVAEQPFGDSEKLAHGPAAGEVWPDSRLLAALDARVGDQLSIGELSLRVSRVLVARPDQGSALVDLTPSVLMNMADLAATGLVQPGSRVTYAGLFAGDRKGLDTYRKWFEEQKPRTARLRDIAEVSPEVNRASERAGRFLSVASLVAVLLCAVAIAMTARRYVKRHLDLAALLKTLGAARAEVLAISLVQLACIALVATIAGSVAGFLAQQGLLLMVKDLIGTTLPPPSLRPVGIGLVTALLLLVGFAMPSMLQLARVPAMRVLRRDIGPPELGTVLAYGPAVLAVMLLLRWVLDNLRQSLWFALGLAVASGVLALAGWVLVRVVGELRGSAGVAWRYGAASLARRRAESIVQIVALGLGLSALLLLAVLRGDLIQDWRDGLPEDAPNYFFANVGQTQRDQFVGFIEQRGGKVARILPMLRGRLLAINDELMAERDFTNRRGEGFATREQNLTWAGEIGPDNKITEGHWFTPEEHGQPLISVSTEIKEMFGLHLGDRMRFDIAGETLEVSISSFREVKWDSVQPNFFLMFPPGLLEDVAGTYMASARFQPTEPGAVADLVRTFPAVSIFDLDGLLTQVRSIVDKAVAAVQSVFLFTLLAGVVVLLAAVQSTREERRYESAILRTLGATRRTVTIGVLVEFALIGLLAGSIAAAVASTGGYLMATKMLDVPYHADPALWATGVLSGALMVCLAGYFATRSALAQPPMQTLRLG